MNVTRNGKIARLPYSIRDILNERLRNGEQGTKLVKWLNRLPEVKEVLAGEFGGRPINEQNLTEWKQGGFNDWLRHQETRAWVRALVDESADLEEEAGDVSVADWLSAPVAIALGRWILEAAAVEKNDPTQRAALLAAAREVTELRRCDHRAERLRIDRERWETEQQDRQNKELEEMRGKNEAAEAYVRFLQADAKCQYEKKIAAGALSPHEEEKFQRIFAKFEEWESSRQALTQRFRSSVLPSNQIKANQTGSSQ